MPVYFLRGWGDVKASNWLAGTLSITLEGNRENYNYVLDMFECLIVTVILSKAKDQEKGGRKRWGGGGLPVGTLLFKGNKVVYQLPNLQIILLYLEVEYLKYLTP